jgi:hypothetical protein
MEDKYDDIIEQLRQQDANAAAEVPETPEIAEVVETPEVPETQETPETPEATPETPETPETPAKSWYDDESVSIIKPAEKPSEPETPVRDYSALENDPDFHLFLSYKESGKGLKDLVTEYTVVDPNTMSEEQLFVQLCDIQNIPEDEREDEYNSFVNKSRLDRNGILDAVKAKIQSDNQNKAKGLFDTNQAGREQALQIQNKFTTEVEGISTSIKGKTILGLQITDEMAGSIKQDIMNFNIVRQDGSIDTESVAELVLLRKYIKDIVKVNVTASKNRGKEEILTEINNPSPKTTKSQSHATRSVHDDVNDYLNDKNK